MFLKGFLLIAILASPVVWAQNPETADSVTKTILAQAQTTEQNIKNIKDKMVSLEPGQVYYDPDHDLLAKEFLDNINQAMTLYDQGMKQVILAEAKHWLDNFAATQKFSPEESYQKDIAANTSARLVDVSKDYHNLVAAVFEKALGQLPQSVAEVSIEPNAEVCGHFTTSSQQTKKGIKYGDPLPHGNAVAKGLAITDWRGQQEGVPQVSRCGIVIEDTKRGHTWLWNLYFFINGNFSEGPIHSDSRDWRDNDFFRHLRLGREIQALITKTLDDKWLGGCHSEKCRQLRLSDLSDFLSVAKVTLLKSIKFDIRSSVPLELSASPINVDQLLEATRKE